jgi:hypothetical protein
VVSLRPLSFRRAFKFRQESSDPMGHRRIYQDLTVSVGSRLAGERVAGVRRQC